MTAEEVLAGLDFAPSMCWMRACTQEATVVARPACGCWTWPLCADHDGWLRGMLQVARVCDVPPHMLMDERDSGSAALINGPVASVYCRTCHRTSPLTLEALSAPGDGQTPPA